MNHYFFSASTTSNTNFNTPTTQYSLGTTQYHIVTLLKHNREGLTISEIERQLQIKIDNDLLQKLRNNEHLQYLPEQQKLVFKFKYNIFSKDELIQHLQQPPNALIIDEDVQVGYPNINEDVQALRQEYKVLCVQHISSKQQVVYWNPIPPPLELLPVSTLPDEIKNRWHRIEPIDFAGLRKVLQQKGIPLSHLTCNTIPQSTTSDGNFSLYNEKNKRGGRSRRLRGFRQHIDNPELAALAEKVQLFNATGTLASNSVVVDNDNTLKLIIGDPSSTLPVTSTQSDGTMTESDNRARYLHHNVDAAPEEFERVVQVLCATAYLFYNDEVAVVLHTFFDQKVQREMDLVHTLLLPQRQVASILSSLMNHHILQRTVCETKAVTALQRTFNVWSLDLDRAIDAINYRLLQMESKLSDEIKQKQDQILLCPVCKIYYRTIDISTLDNPAPNVYCCSNCPQHTKLETVDNSQEVRTKQKLLSRMTELLKPLKTMLQSLTASSTTRKNSSAESFRMNVSVSTSSSLSSQSLPTPSTFVEHQKQKVPSIRTERGGRSRKSSTHLNNHTTTSQSSVPSTASPTFVTPRCLPDDHSLLTQSTSSNDKNSSVNINTTSSLSQTSAAVLSTSVSFHTQPLYFGTGCDVYLPIITELSEWEREVGVQLAKELLDSIADFESIINARVFKYIITKHSLYIAYKRGFRAAEILRLLRTLARNPMPRQLHELISNEENYIHYYRAVLVLREGSFFVQSTDLSVINALLRDTRISKLAAHPDQILRIQQSTLSNSSHPNKPENVQDKTNFNSEQKSIPQYAFEILPGSTEAIKKYSYEAGYPIIDEFDFAADLSLNIQIKLRARTDVRDYQKTSCHRIFWEGLCPAVQVSGIVGHSGVLVLPCGAGKTLIGINVMAILKKSVIIFCQSILAVTQWKEQLHRFTTLTDVCRFTSMHTDEWNPHASVIITTYPMFSKPNHSSKSSMMIEKVKTREWGLMILDEVHLTPANQFRKVTNTIRSHLKLGLTATMVREDELIAELPFLVGPKLYELDIFTLRMRGHIAYVECHELHIPLTEEFSQAYSAAEDSSEERRLIYTTNPNKTRVCATLIRRHLERGHKIMVFCDSLFALDWYAQMLKRPKICGKVPPEERAEILRHFRSSKGGDCVLFSKVGDQSIDLPEADVVIQLALLDGSRMQEGQRIGRIQRPQEGKERAYFYSLVSKDTEEMEYATKRRGFLQEHGYIVSIEENWKDLVTADTENVIDQQVQFELLDAIVKNLQDKKDKTQVSVMTDNETGNNTNNTNNDDDEEAEETIVETKPYSNRKRKKTNVRDELRKRMRTLR